MKQIVKQVAHTVTTLSFKLLRTVLKLPFNLRLGLASGLLPFVTKFLYVFIFPMCVTYLVNPILLNLITVV
jgi:hypothetical protein